jgi:excinuclease ABC subunit A
VVDQKPIGRTPRSNLATYTGLFDHVRKLFAATKQARARRYDAGRFSFNVAKGRCETCQGEGFVCVELLFLPSVYAPCPTCKGARYNAKTLEIKIRDKSIADVLAMTVDNAFDFFPDDPSLRRSLGVLREVGLGYIRLGQAATELSGGEAQRIKLATELQRAQRGETLYVLDEPTTGLHPSDVAKLMTQLDGLVESGNTVIVVKHDMGVAAASDWMYAAAWPRCRSQDRPYRCVPANAVQRRFRNLEAGLAPVSYRAERWRSSCTASWQSSSTFARMRFRGAGRA